MKTREKERRDSGLIILLILLLGFICIILASGWAIRFAPNWKANTNMGSNLDPNSDFLTSRPVNYVEPLDPAILTNPAWIDVFLTPGASFETRIPLPTGTATATLAPVQPTNTLVVPSAAASPTNIPVITAFPTITRTSAPPPPATVTPIPPSPTNTTVPPTPSADLQITKSDGVTTYTPGGSPLIYAIRVMNNGTSAVTGAVVTDNKPAQVSTWTWVCTSQTGGASGCSGAPSSGANFTDTVNLPSGAWIDYTVTANTSAAATGNLLNTASVAVPLGFTDPIPGNNSATDTDTQNLPAADLQIAKDDGVTTYLAGSVLTYTVTVTNAGPSAVAGAVVTDNKPTQVTTWTWVCTSQNNGASGCDAAASSSADFSDTVNLPNVGSNIVYTVTANISGTATGNLVNIANVAIPPAYTDPISGNNSATDTDVFNVLADLQITKTDSVITYTAGGPLTYTVTVRNNGPSAVTGAVVTDNIPAQISTWTWVCTSQNFGATGCDAAPSNSADFSDTVNLPNVNSNIVYTVTANTFAAATGNLANTANVAVPAVGYTDPTPGNNSATDTDTASFSTNLQISKTNGGTTYTPGGPITYTIVVWNSGPSNATGVSVADTIPTSITGITFNCVTSGTASCGTSNFDFPTNTLSFTGANIAAGPATNFLTITVSGSVISGKLGNMVNTATVAEGPGQTDPTPGNNSATDTDAPAYSSDLSITKTDGATHYVSNAIKTYSIVVSNAGPSDALGATVTDIFSTNSNLASATWSCSATGAASCTANGSGDINDTVNIAVGATVTYTVTANVSASPFGSLMNTATVSLATDPISGNNSATDSDLLIVVNSGNIGTTPDGVLENIPNGSVLTFQLGSPLVVGSHASYDLVYYPDPTLQMDMVILQVGDGSNWLPTYFFFNWGDGSPDGNTDIPAGCPGEPDNCVILAPPNNPPGISINLDGVVPNGTYNYIRIFSPDDSAGGNDGVDVDAIAVLP